MSHIFTFKSTSPVLSIDFVNPILLDSSAEYGLALIGFHSYNSIPNIEEGENKFYYIDPINQIKKVITIPTGSYEISDIENYIRQIIITEKVKKEQYDQFFSLKPNNNTLKCEIRSEKYQVDFTPSDSIARILGFSNRILEPSKQLHESDLPVDIVKVRIIHIDCNITTGAFYNQNPSHTIYEFSVGVDAGFAIDEVPKNLIYLPLSYNKREIRNITLSVLNQDFHPVNFRGENIIIRLELKKL